MYRKVCSFNICVLHIWQVLSWDIWWMAMIWVEIEFESYTCKTNIAMHCRYLGLICWFLHEVTSITLVSGVNELHTDKIILLWKSTEIRSLVFSNSFLVSSFSDFFPCPLFPFGLWLFVSLCRIVVLSTPLNSFELCSNRGLLPPTKVEIGQAARLDHPHNLPKIKST